MKTLKTICVVSIVLSTVAWATEPKSSTYDARQITDSSALLRGAVVDDGGEDCEAQYRYWEKGTGLVMVTGWFDKTPDDPNENPFHTGDFVVARIFDLKPETTYMFVLELKNSDDTDEEGRPNQFTTLAAGEDPAAPLVFAADDEEEEPAEGSPRASTYDARQITDSSALLRGAVVDDGGEDCEAQYRYWEKGTGLVMATGWFDKTPDDPNENPFHAGDFAVARITDLKADTTYCFVLELVNSNGADEDGTPNEFTTLAAGELPGSPLVFAADDDDEEPAEGSPKSSTYDARQVTDSSALLRGGVVDDGGEDCLRQFRYWDKGTGLVMFTGWHDKTPDDPNDDPYHSGDIAAARVFGLKPGTTYMFVLELKNSNGTDENGSPSEFTTLPALVLLSPAVPKSSLDTLYVDVSTPDYLPEGGSATKPYDSIQETIDVAPAGATVIVRRHLC